MHTALSARLHLSTSTTVIICGHRSTFPRQTFHTLLNRLIQFVVQILVNISLIYDYRRNSVYEQCKGLVQHGFERDNLEVTSELRQIFFPLACPGISTDRGGVLVDSGYFCRRTNQVRIKIQPGGSSHLIDVCGMRLINDLVCLFLHKFCFHTLRFILFCEVTVCHTGHTHTHTSELSST